MYTRARGLAISTILLAYGAVGAMAQDRMAPRPDQQQVQTQQRGANPMGQEGMIGGGMMGPGMMGPGMMGPPPIMLRMMLVLIDTDSDGAISLQEFQAAHERIFKAMDTNKDGKLTLEEMQTFMYGTR